MRSSTRCPRGLSAKAVTTAVFRPKQRFSPRATLYSPPPSDTSKLRVVHTRRSPGSKRSMTSPRLTKSQRQLSSGLSRGVIEAFCSSSFQLHGFELGRNQVQDGKSDQIRRTGNGKRNRVAAG